MSSDVKERWATFFGRYYEKQILKLASDYPEVTSIDVDYQMLQNFDIALTDALLEGPVPILRAAHEALLEYDLPIECKLEADVRIVNVSDKIKIRDLRSTHVGKLVSMEGIVRKATEVRPKLTAAAFECLNCGHVTTVEQDEARLKEPTECTHRVCRKRGPFKLSFTHSKFVDAQKIRLQEFPEGLKGGEQPQTLDVNVEGSLSGKVFPGDRVAITGLLRVAQRQYQNVKNTTFDLFLDANSIEVEDKAFLEIEILQEDEAKIVELAKKADIKQAIVSSFAPSIFGYESVKEAIALQLFSGVPKSLPDGSHVRGDIHILLVGDPGIAKSQLLRYVIQLAPRGIYTSGKSSTSAGLTATAIKDEFGDGRWTLEAGALVLADQGIAAVDEMDKMRAEDRSSLHEAMEQQTISVAKAGIVATLQSHCALLGAANPRYGRFDPYESIAEQINMQPTLLSRFDLIFVLTDVPNEGRDTDIAKHILASHFAGELAASGSPDQEVHAASYSLSPAIEVQLLRKFIAYAKRINPVLSEDAKQQFIDYYVGLRKQGGEGSPIPITARQLEALVRLGEASARMRLSRRVTLDDAKRVIQIVEACLKEVGVDPETGRRDFDVIAVGRSKSQQERIKSIRDIIRELEREAGSAPLDKIIERASRLGFDKDKVEAEIFRLVQEAVIFEPVRYSGNYRLTQQ
ncbi:MAG TPA: minichromosome maintenance protein MCM [Candidatus Acidoferrales bacterium]|nr:minichromosome maintenance protein MCM [Candidatus Acidoferrales bacterium]